MLAALEFVTDTHLRGGSLKAITYPLTPQARLRRRMRATRRG
jgi:hypothetical protein